MFCCRILVNCQVIEDFKIALENLFILLLANRESILTQDAKLWFDSKIKKLDEDKICKCLYSDRVKEENNST